MKILKETDVEYVKMDIDFEDGEHALLLEYGKSKIKPKELDDLVLEWAFVDIIKNTVKYYKKETKKKKTSRKTKLCKLTTL